jgi:hypothetical protein
MRQQMELINNRARVHYQASPWLIATFLPGEVQRRLSRSTVGRYRCQKHTMRFKENNNPLTQI